MSALRPWLRLALRGVVAAVLLALAFRMAVPEGQRSVAEALAGSWTVPLPQALLWFAAACAIFGASFAVVAARFRVLLRAVGLEAPFRPILRAYLVANFLTLVLPTALLSDAYRVADARRDAGRGAEVLAMAALERVLSLAALACVVLAAAPFVPAGSATGQRLRWGLLAAAAVAVASLAALSPRGSALLSSLLAPLLRLSPRLDGIAQRVLAATAELATRRGVLLRAFVLSLLAVALPVAAVVALAVPLGAPVSWYWYAVIVPVVTLVILVPVSVGGAGVREFLFIELFGALGMRAEVALALSLSVFATTLLWGLVGLALFARGRRSATAVGSAP